MSEAIWGGILSAVIAGIFSLLAKRMELNPSRVGAVRAAPLMPDAAVPAPASVPVMTGGVNVGSVLRHIGVIQFVLNIVGLLTGFSLGSTGASQDTILMAVIIVGSLVLIAAFFWSALNLPRSERARHLLWVAVGVAITTLIINSIILAAPINLASLLFATVQNSVCAFLGLLLANTVKK